MARRERQGDASVIEHLSRCAPVSVRRHRCGTIGKISEPIPENRCRRGSGRNIRTKREGWKLGA
jgi:hypothetical protein